MRRRSRTIRRAPAPAGARPRAPFPRPAAPRPDAPARRFRIVISDGARFTTSMAASQLATMLKGGELQAGCFARLNKFVLNTIQNKDIVILLDVAVVGAPTGLVGAPTSYPDGAPVPTSLVKSWIEEKEGTANLWLVVTEPDGDQIRIPARREFISHFSKLINDLPVAEDSECPLIGFDAETVVEFCRACLPRLDALPKIGNIQRLCKLVKLAHFLDAPQIFDRWWAELQRYQPAAGDDYIAIFDLNRDLPGKTFTINQESLSSFPKAYLTLDETIKKKYEKKAYESFQQAILKLDEGLDEGRAHDWNTQKHYKQSNFPMLYDMVKCLLEMARPASTS